MWNADPDAIVCDFAEYYHIHDIRTLPLSTAASFAQGLPPESRTMRGLGGLGVSTETALLAAVADRLGTLIWMLQNLGGKKTDPPPSILETLTGKHEEAFGFDSATDFAAAWARLTGSENHE